MSGQTRPTHCRECGRPLRSSRTPEHEAPGTVPHRGKGLCATHYVRRWHAEHPQPKKPEREPRWAAIIEDAEWLARTGETWINAPRRLGVSAYALDQTLRRHDRVDLIAALKRGMDVAA